MLEGLFVTRESKLEHLNWLEVNQDTVLSNDP